MDANKIRTRETVTLSCRNEGCWRSDRIRNHSWHRSLHNYLSCCFRQVVLSREWSLSAMDLGWVFAIGHSFCLGAGSDNCGVSMCSVRYLAETSNPLAATLVLEFRAAT